MTTIELSDSDIEALINLCSDKARSDRKLAKELRSDPSFGADRIRLAFTFETQADRFDQLRIKLEQAE